MFLVYPIFDFFLALKFPNNTLLARSFEVIVRN